MPSYNTSQFKKGLKIQLDGDPYLMVECNFVKPGKGQALYKCRLKNLVRQTMLDRTYKSGDSLEPPTSRKSTPNISIARATRSCSWTTRPTSSTS